MYVLQNNSKTEREREREEREREERERERGRESLPLEFLIVFIMSTL